MFVRECAMIEPWIKGIVVVNYVNAAINQQIAVVIRAVSVANQLVKPVYPRKAPRVDMPKILFGVKNIFTVLDIQRSEDELIGENV